MTDKYVTIDDVSCESQSTETAETTEASSSVPTRYVLPADFRMLYESRDGRFCLFETRDGHLSAVKASRFA